MKMKRTVCYAIEPAENGWVVTENVFIEPEATPLDSDDDESNEQPGYDPSASFAQATEKQVSCTASRESKAYVFASADHAKMIQFVSDRTRPPG